MNDWDEDLFRQNIFTRPAEPPSRMSTLGFTATWAAGVAFACLFIGEGAQFALDHRSYFDSTAVAEAEAAKSPKFNAIDFATTASVKGQTVVLAPCGAAK